MDDVLIIDDLTKSFGATPVLSGVTLTLKRGQILGLAGENGAGKSTLANLISGRLKADSGSIRLNGSCYVLPQEFSLIPTLTVCDNIFLGRERSRFGVLDTRAMCRRAKELFAELGCAIDPERMASTLSVAEKQMTEIAKSLLFDSNLLILDEPTTVLSRQETEKLFSLLRQLRDKGTAIIFVTHKLDEMLSLCDEVAVLRDGVLVSQNKTSGLTPYDVACKMVGRNLAQAFPEKTIVPEDAPVRFVVEHLSSADGLVKDVSFFIRRGEILGLAGLAGAGRTELAETICCLRKRKKKSGVIRIDGKVLTAQTPQKIFHSGISCLSEDRQGTALLTEQTVYENITLTSLLQKYSSWGIVSKKKQICSAQEYIKLFRIKCESPEVAVSGLSGGNQQKVALAKGLDTDPVVFLFDEPTRGVDVGARREIYDFIHELAAQGVSCLLISSDLQEIIGNCTRVLVMHNGTIRGEVSGNDISEENIILYAAGVK
ncbi:MAG: sugar ABC transporter ATP-binding protein [Lentisphaeria bacterium]|nr:sugar ABC transporter ATP-binding protein [Lentisphaeria bacterium]